MDKALRDLDATASVLEALWAPQDQHVYRVRSDYIDYAPLPFLASDGEAGPRRVSRKIIQKRRRANRLARKARRS